MEKSSKKILDRYGYDFEIDKLQPASRERVAANIFRHIINSEDRDNFVSGLSSYLYQTGKVNQDGNIEISIGDPEVLQYTIAYGMKKVIDHALDEDLDSAYKLLSEYTMSNKYTNKTATGLTEDDLAELGEFFSQTAEMFIAKQLCDLQLEISATLQGKSDKVLTSYQANRMQEKFEELVPCLDFEQRAAGYYNLSIIHRALLGEKETYDPMEGNAEKECLKKVLEYTADYKRIGYCVNRLGPNKGHAGLVRAAYRRALTEAESDNDLYKINLALADCYVEDRQPVTGFRVENKFYEEDEKLKRAIMYYSDALQYAPVPEQLNVLKKIAKQQRVLGDSSAWAETMTKMAMEHMTGEERCHTLMEVAHRIPSLKESYLDRVIYEAAKSKHISKNKKGVIIAGAEAILRPLYIKSDNQKGLSYLDKMMAKFAPRSSVSDNPLVRYKRRKTR